MIPMMKTWDPDNRPGCHDLQVLSWWQTRKSSCECWLFFFQVQETTQIRDTNTKHGLRKTNKQALHCYVRSNPTLKGYGKRMIEIWQECTSFLAISQSLTDQVRTIKKKSWFSDLEILEIHQKINNEQDSNTISDTPSIDKQEQSKRNEPPTSENRNTSQLNTP